MRFIDFINEASVRESNLASASRKVAQFIGRKIGSDFKEINGETYKNADGVFFGILYVSDNNDALRVNWDGKKFYSINYWDDYAGSANQPSKEIKTADIGPNDASFVQLLPEIIRAITTESETSDEMYESFIVEKVIKYEDSEWKSPADFIKDVAADWTIDQIQSVLKQNGNTYNKKQIQAKVDQVLGTESEPEEPKKKGGKKVVVETGKPEKVAPPECVKKANETLAKTKYSDPDVVFENLNEYTQMVATGYSPALLITGQGGIGKSYNVNQVLAKYGTKGEDYVIMKGKCTPIKMYKFLYTHYNQICVFDDCDSVFDSKDGINILKGVLDSGENREVSWDNANTVDTFGMTRKEIETELATAVAAGVKNPIPSYFEFDGAVIFISNLTYDDIYKKDRALPTRCLTIDINLKAEDVINRIKTCLPSIKIYKALAKNGENKDITDEAIKKEVFEFMISDEFKQILGGTEKELNFRSFIKLYMLRHAGLEHWKRLAAAI